MYISQIRAQNHTYNSPTFQALPEKYKEVDKYLIRGPHPHIKDVFTLKKEGINKIYDFRHYGLRGFKWIERLACKAAGVEYIRKQKTKSNIKLINQNNKIQIK